jgi:cytochrome c-type biogenesis protein CcmF
MTGIGRLAVWIALLAGCGAAVAPLVGRPARARPLLALSAGAAALATAVLGRALVVSDWSLVYVADFSRRGTSAPYRLAGLWGGMAGSLLALSTLMAVAGLVFAGRAGAATASGGDEDGNGGGGAGAVGAAGERRRVGGIVAGVTGAVVASLLALVLAFADPFATLVVPAIDGSGLTPILEHPAMLYHPPLLYLGLATLVGPFALTVAALVDRRLDDRWLATARRWALLPWTLLAVGMVAGAHWAYVELGWGGYWAWDPVENTALLPWLAVTVFLHAARGLRTDRPPVSRVAVAGLACLPFALALLGSLLTRSGATSSVHAFAESRAIGRALAVTVAVATVAVTALLVRAARGPGPTRDPAGTAGPTADRDVGAGSTHAGPMELAKLAEPAGPAGSTASATSAGPATGGRADGPVTVARLTGAHVAVGGAALAVVLAGTLWPLATDLRGGDGIAIEGTYFARFTGPLATAALALACLVPVAVAGARDRARPVAAAAAGGAVGALALLAAVAPTVPAPAVLLGAAAGACLAAGGVGAARAARRRDALGGHLAHAAFGLLALGIAGTATGGTVLVPMAPGDVTEVLGHEIAYAGVTVEDGPVAGSSAVVADVTADGQRLRPALDAYPDRALVLPETSLRSTPTVDVQVALRTATDAGAAQIEVGVHPLQVWVWWGGLALVAAGAYALVETSRRARPDLPTPRRSVPLGRG